MRKILLDLKKGPKHWYNEVIQARIGPREIALGFGIGVFTGMLAVPIINILLLLLAIAILRINKLAAFLGYVLLLWPTSPFIYYTSLRIGMWIFGNGKIGSVSDVTFQLIKQYGVSFILGNLIFSGFVAVLAFLATYGITKTIEIIKKRSLPPNDKVS
ncbi:MAG: DUF2062 domain-containing protein [archaeon]